MKERVFVFTFTKLVVPSLEKSVLFRETNVNISLKYVLPFSKVNTDRPLKLVDVLSGFYNFRYTCIYQYIG